MKRVKTRIWKDVWHDLWRVERLELFEGWKLVAMCTQYRTAVKIRTLVIAGKLF